MPSMHFPSPEVGAPPGEATPRPGADREQLREAIRATLAQRAGSAAGASAVAQAALDTWEQMAGRLATLVGVRGVEILYGRALHLAAARFPWLDPGQGRASDGVRPAELKACLAGQEAAVAAEGANALLVTFSELLATLIGEALTARLLGPVWVPPVLEAEGKGAP